MVHTYQSGYWVNICNVDFTHVRLLVFFGKQSIISILILNKFWLVFEVRV
jgi:hypothetical protein